MGPHALARVPCPETLCPSKAHLELLLNDNGKAMQLNELLDLLRIPCSYGVRFDDSQGKLCHLK